MKKLIIILAILGMIVPTMGMAASVEDVSLLDSIKPDYREMYIQAVDKNVQLASECEQDKADMAKTNKDKIAVAVAVTAVVASGGTIPVAIGMWKVISLPFVLLGF